LLIKEENLAVSLPEVFDSRNVPSNTVDEENATMSLKVEQQSASNGVCIIYPTYVPSYVSSATSSITASPNIDLFGPLPNTNFNGNFQSV
jgi:hypothetical protein